jgi:hypothetical protein
MNFSRIFRPAVVALAALSGLACSGAASAATCGITGSASAMGLIYDPFNPNGQVSAQIALNLTRINGSGGEKTDIVNFYIKSANTGANGISVIPRSVVGAVNVAGLNLDIFYDTNEATPVVSPTTLDPSSANKFLKVYFTGNNTDSDTVTVNFDLTLPPNLNLNASTTIGLDAEFGCSTTGGGKGTQQTGTLANTIRFPITVLSGLRASFVGTALDFGEIGNVTTTQVTNAPATYVTPPTAYVRVESSGVYKVTVASQNGFKMTYNGANGAAAIGSVPYRLKFLGATMSPTAPPPAEFTCPRAGVGAAFEDHLPLQAQLIEGGAGKTVSPTYSDTLTVTLTPQAIASSTNNPECGGPLSGSF